MTLRASNKAADTSVVGFIVSVENMNKVVYRQYSMPFDLRISSVNISGLPRLLIVLMLQAEVDLVAILSFSNIIIDIVARLENLRTKQTHSIKQITVRKLIKLLHKNR